MQLKKLFIFFILAFILISASGTYAQKANFFKRYINTLVNDTADISKPQFLVYPTVAYGPETSWEFGLSSIFVYYANYDTTNRLSEIHGFSFITLQNQYGIYVDHALYSDKNKWLGLGRLRFQSFPLLYHGIGADAPSQYIARVDANQLQIRERILRKVHNNLYLGGQLDFQRLSSVEFVTPNSDDIIIKPLGHEGSANLGLGLGGIYDNRHNVLNVRDGSFFELAFARYDKRWGSDHSFSTIISDNRWFTPINKRDVLAAQVLGQFNFGEIPFNQLALMGGENIMRGYYLGRYRDKNQLVGQLEYRFLPLPLGFTKRWGAAVFGSAGTVFNEISSLAAKDIVYAGGGGIRFLIFPQKDIYTRLDVAFTSEGTGFYIFVGEAF